MLAALAGGVGAARMLRALSSVIDPSEITAVVNTGDDLVLHGLTICPDLDTLTYTLAGLDNTETGWGLTGETWRVMEELESLGGEAWFRLGDRDLATHLYRSQRLSVGATLTEVTREIAERRGVAVRMLPMSDDPAPTRVRALVDGAEVDLSFQEYFVGHHHSVPVRSLSMGGGGARPGPAVLAALDEAEMIVICPSNPLVSIAPVLAVPGIAECLRVRRDAVVAVSPIVAGAALKGPADRLLTELGHESSAVGVARYYAGLVGTLVIDTADAALAPAVEAEGLRCVVTDTVMATPAVARSLAEVVLHARRS